MQITKENSHFMPKDDIIRIKTLTHEPLCTGPHTHDSDQILFTGCGSILITAPGTSLFVPEHHIVTLPAGNLHEVTSNGRPVSLTAINCSRHAADRTACYHSDQYSGGILRYIRERCAEEIRFSDNPCAHEFIISFIKMLPQMCRISEIPLSANLIPRGHRLRPVLDYISEHCTEEGLTLPEVARKTGYSPRNLSRMFKEAGILFANCLSTHRVTRAIELMSDRKLTLREIAYSTGFSTPSGFNRTFRKITGRRPEEFR